MLPLFDTPPQFDKAGLAARLKGLAQQGLWIGGSSWKYEGWLDQIYTRDRYLTRGRFSQKRFEAECIAEYAEVFPIVCGDFSFYQFPAPEFWHKLFSTAPPSLQFALKVPEEITVEVFPTHPRYGARAGMPNESYLHADALSALFLEPLGPYRERISALIFEFGSRATPRREFVHRLGQFLDHLPPASKGGFRYSVEIRNRSYLEPDYLDCLRERNVAHVLNSWTRMPSLVEQSSVPGVFTADFTVVRALLRPGRAYEQAVEKFAPYTDVVEEYPEGRAALEAILRRMREERRTALVFVNNRFEGNSPKTIQAITDPAVLDRAASQQAFDEALLAEERSGQRSARADYEGGDESNDGDATAS